MVKIQNALDDCIFVCVFGYRAITSTYALYIINLLSLKNSQEVFSKHFSTVYTMSKLKIPEEINQLSKLTTNINNPNF